jgi:putative ABC transport system ATP-binding protein
MSELTLAATAVAASIVATGLSKQFSSGPEDVRAVDDVSFSLPKAKLIAVKGPSGCGKSTLLNLLGALDRPSSGQLMVDGVDVGALSGREEVAYRRKKVGFVFQSFNLIPWLTAVENVRLPMELNPDSSGQDHDRRARELLLHVGIPTERQNHRPAKLSGGQQQRVAIARAIANDPPVILADEPTANLDQKTSRLIVDLLQGLSLDGRTVIIATHDTAISEAAQIMLEMEDGKIIRQTGLALPIS